MATLARSSTAATATSARRRPDAASGRPVCPNSRQKRSAERSARHHAQLQVQFYRTAIAVLYICRLRRMCRARRLQARLADLESLDGEPVSVDSGGPQARSEQTALSLLPPLLRLRVPPVQAVLRCLEVSTMPSARLCCFSWAGRGSSSVRQRPRYLTPVACDACATAPTC